MALQRRKLGGSAHAEGGAGDNKPHVLYVEDDDTNWAVAELNLGSKINLERAKTSREAMSLLARSKFDLILMDIELAGSDLNGTEIAAVLKGLYNKVPPAYASGITAMETPIVFVTAYSGHYSKEDLTAFGAVEAMAKPVNFIKLTFLISRLVVRGAMAPS